MKVAFGLAFGGGLEDFLFGGLSVFVLCFGDACQAADRNVQRSHRPGNRVQRVAKRQQNGQDNRQYSLAGAGGPGVRDGHAENRDDGDRDAYRRGRAPRTAREGVEQSQHGDSQDNVGRSAAK